MSVTETEAECPESPLQGQYFLSYLISVRRGEGGGGGERGRDDGEGQSTVTHREQVNTVKKKMQH